MAKEAAKLTKRETHYTPVAEMPSQKCERCVHFRRPDACALVAGDIKPGAWCNRFIKRAGT